MMRPFGSGTFVQQACNMGDIFSELQAKLARLEQFEQGAIEDMAPS